MAGGQLGPGKLADRAATDRSVYALIAANLVAAAIALGFRMDLRDLMLVYWTQSVIIGLTHFIRMASLRNFSTDGMKLNSEPVEAVSENKWRFAVFFHLHYGIFHAGYLVFIALDAGRAGEAPISTAGLWLCALVFAVNHGFSLRHNLASDRQGSPNLGTLMMLPYARILPMHVTILIGGAYFGGFKALLVFVILKTLADVFMHVMEHAVLQKEPLLHRLD
jgi:hypothetical protein